MGEKEYLLGIDLGTTTCKVALFWASGELVAISGREYPTYYPKPGWAEQDAGDWWNVTVETIRDVLKKSKVDPGDIQAISVSSHREAVALLNGENRVLDKVIIWLDKRSIPQAKWIEKNFDLWDIYRKTGLRVDPTFTATKLLWIKENKPEILEKTKVALQPKDYLIFKLTGEKITDYTVASRTLLFDIEKREWAYDLFEDFGLPSDIFPEVKYSDEIVGFIDSRAAAETGLKEGTPVAGGGGDRQCEILGSGVTSSNKVEESTGTGSTTATVLEKLIFDKKMRVVYTCHALRGMWSLEVGIATAGAVLRWFRDQFAVGEKFLAELTKRRAYEYLDMEAEYVPPGSNGLIVIPFFAGARAPRWKPYAKGLIFGLTIYHTRAHVFRALMEGIAYEIRKVLEVLEELGVKTEEIRALGGGGKTPAWARIKANVTGKRVIIPEILDAAVVGDAILAGLSIGVYENVEKAVDRLVKIKTMIEPDWKVHKIYNRYYRLYEALIEAVEPFYKEITEMAEYPRPEVPWDIDKLIHLLYKLET